MKIKHKVVKEFQYLSPDKKIFILKAGTVLEEYVYKVKSELINIDKDIIDNNPDFFETLDWKVELLSFMRSEKMPQPAQLGKKLVPFIEDMILSSIPHQSGTSLDESKIKELEWKETDINNREKRVKDKEEEIEIRAKRIEKREIDHKEDLKSLDKKEDELRQRSRELTEKQIDIEDKIQDLKEKERNFDRSLLESSKDLDSKYSELQSKIDSDLKLVSDKEKELENLSKDLKRKEDSLAQIEADINDKIRDYNSQKEELNLFIEEVRNLNQEIKDWENSHWKMKRNTKPPSCID